MKTYNKLIRDRIPEIIEKEGSKCKTRILNDEEYKGELLKKLEEEVGEVIEARGDGKELVKELGDVLEVIDSLVRAFELDKKEVEAVKEERKDSRGGFDKKLFLEYTD